MKTRDELMAEKAVLLYELERLEDLDIARMLPDVVLARIDEINRKLNLINYELAKISVDKVDIDEL